jgi:hypothetical protein
MPSIPPNKNIFTIPYFELKKKKKKKIFAKSLNFKKNLAAP